MDCTVITHGQTREFSSMGRRKRRGATPYGVGSMGRVADKDDMVVVQTIQITDKFGFEKEDKLPHRRFKDEDSGEWKLEIFPFGVKHFFKVLFLLKYTHVYHGMYFYIFIFSSRRAEKRKLC